MKFKNKLLLVFIFLATLSLFTSCKKEKDQNDKTDTQSNIYEINILVENLKDYEYINFIGEAYQELNQDTSINVFNTDDFDTSINNPDNSYDLFFYKPYKKNYDDIKTQIKLQDISLLDEQNEIFLDSDIKDMVNENGSHYVFPVIGDIQGFIINKKLFSQHGLNIPVTSEDLIYVSNKIKEASLYPFQFYITPTEKFLDLHIALMGVSDNSLEDFVQGVAENENKAEQINEYTKMVNLIFDNIDYSLINFEYQQGLNDFASDRSFMLPGSCEDLLTLLYINPDMELDFMPFPSNKNSLPLKILRGFSMTQDSPNKEAALNFLKFFNNPDTGKYYINKTASVSLLPNAKSEIKEFNTISNKIFDMKPFINFNESIDDALRINLRDDILNYINDRDVGKFTNSLKNTLQYINNDFKSKERF